MCVRAGTLRSLTQRAQTLNHRRQCCPNTLYLDIGCCCVRTPVHAHTAHTVIQYTERSESESVFRDGTGLPRFHARFAEEGTRINEPICGKYSVWRPSGLRKGALASSQLLPLAMREDPRVDAVRPQRAKARTVVSCPPGRCTTRKFLPDSALLPPLPARCRAALGRRPWGSERVAQRRACRRGDPDGTHVRVHRAVPRLDPPPQLVQRRRAGAAKAVQVEPRSKPGGQHRLRPKRRRGGRGERGEGRWARWAGGLPARYPPLPPLLSVQLSAAPRHLSGTSLLSLCHLPPVSRPSPGSTSLCHLSLRTSCAARPSAVAAHASVRAYSAATSSADAPACSQPEV